MTRLPSPSGRRAEMPMCTGVGLGLDRHGRLVAIVAAVMGAGALGGCTGPNPTYDRLDALDRPEASTGRDQEAPGGTGGTGGGGGGPGATDALTADAAPGPDLSLPPDAGAPDQASDAAMLPPDTAAPPPDAPLPPDAPSPDLPGVDAPRPPTTRYNFEASTQGWGDLRPGSRPTPPVVSRVGAPAPAWDGQYALAVNLTSTASSTHAIVGVAQMFRSQLPANTEISFRLWLPSGDALEYVQPFVLYYKSTDADGNPQWGGIDPPLFTADLPRQQWVLITHRVPSNADSRGVVELGFEFVMRPSRSATVYIDGVHW